MQDVTLTGLEVCGEGLRISVEQEEFDLEDFVRYTTYGVTVTRHNGEPYTHISDISLDRAFVEHFAAICEERRVAGIHIMDVLMDLMP